MTVRNPDWTQRDPYRDAVEQRFRRIAEIGDRVLRVAIVETDAEFEL